MTTNPLLAATGNAGKVAELRQLLGERFRVLSPADPALAARRAPAVIEDGTTYFENALKKAVAYQRVYQVAVLADDSGLEIDVLGGEPGLHSARYGGENLTWPERWQAVYAALAPFPKERWTARFRAVLCWYDGRSVPRFFEGVCEGRIHPEPRGGQGFGYDPIVYANALRQTFGEASDADKNRVSHRAEAVRAFLRGVQPA